MDKESETDFSKKIDITEQKPELDEKKDPKAAADNKAKSLHLANYDNIENVLKPFEKQTGDLMRQRDQLADALNTVSENLKIPETYGTTVFKSLKTYDEKKKNLLDSVAKVNTRDEAIVEQIVSSSKALGFTVNPTVLKDLENFRPALNEFGGKVDAFKKRMDSYSSHIKTVCGIMEITSPSMESEDYAGELSSAEGKFKEKKAEHENTKKELTATKDELNETKDKLKNELAAKAELEKQKAEMAERVENMKQIIAGEGFPTDRKITNEDLLRKLTGKVVEVDDKWNFVIIQFDHEGQVKVHKPPFGKEFVPVEIPVGRTLMVSRKDQPVAEIKITRVLDSCSVADIVPTKKWSEIQPGDVVKFPEAN
jgi:chromosome segregation ATPase